MSDEVTGKGTYGTEAKQFDFKFQDDPAADNQKQAQDAAIEAARAAGAKDGDALSLMYKDKSSGGTVTRDTTKTPEVVKVPEPTPPARAKSEPAKAPTKDQITEALAGKTDASAGGATKVGNGEAGIVKGADGKYYKLDGINVRELTEAELKTAGLEVALPKGDKPAPETPPAPKPGGDKFADLKDPELSPQDKQLAKVWAEVFGGDRPYNAGDRKALTAQLAAMHKELTAAIKAERGKKSPDTATLDKLGRQLKRVEQLQTQSDTLIDQADGLESGKYLLTTNSDGQQVLVQNPSSGYTGTMNGITQGLQATTAMMNAGAGLVGSIGNYGFAGQYIGAGFGRPPGGGIGFGYSDGNGGYGGFSGPGGSMVGINGGGFGGGGFGYGDYSNTGFGIGQQCGDAKAKARHLDNIINMLLCAIACGNIDMITSALTMCNMKAKTTLIGAAVNMVRAMQLYDRNMKIVSDKMGEVAGKGADGPAQLAQLNAEMNQMSMARQGITNTTRDIMGMVEEISNLENSVYSKKDREAQFYRWA